MPAEALCDQLTRCQSLSEREAALQASGLEPDALALVLDKARSLLSGAPEAALALAVIAAETASARNEFLTAASASRVQGQAHRLLGRHREAIAAFEIAAEAARQAGDARLAAQVQIGSVDSLGMIGRYEDALNLAQSLETALQEMGAEEDAARVLVNAGSLHFRRDQYARALDAYERAGEILARGEDSTVAARIWSNCANALTHLNRLDEAVALYEQARACFVARGMDVETAFVDTNLGFLHFVSGRLAQALAALTQARSEFQKRNREPEAARCAIDLGEVYRALNLFPEALECYESATVVLERLEVDYDRARAELGRAASRLALGQRQEAETSLLRADRIFRRQKNALQVAHVHLIRAYLRRAEGEEDAARRHAGSAARTFARNRLMGLAAEARFLLAEMALIHGQGGTRAMRNVVRAAQETARGWLECRGEHALGRHAVRQGKIEPGLRHLRAAASALLTARTLIAQEEIHVAFLRDKVTIYEDLIGTLLARCLPHDVEEALEYVEQSKSRLLLARMQAVVESGLSPPQAAPETLERLAELRSALSQSYYSMHTLTPPEARRLGQENPAQREVLLARERAYSEALRNEELPKAQAARALIRQITAVPARDLCAALQPDETLVEFYIFREQICAFVLSPDGVSIIQNVARLEDVQFAARRLRYQLRRLQMPSEYAAPLQAQFESGTRDILRDLYDRLLRPLEARLTEKVVIVPHGILHGLPFHAFYDGSQYALDRWEIVCAPSAAVWHRGVRERVAAPPDSTKCGTSRCATIIGVSDSGMERIGEEVAAIASCLPDAQLFCGESATLENFLAQAERSRILHLATHAMFRNDNPLFSGLQFTDGWLLARDLYGLRLDCDLATLSACQTGMTVVDAGDELFGLIRGFLGAGVRSVAASLWAADDRATAFLMTCFYAHLSEGWTPARALRQAQQQTREVYPHPYYWAAFGLIGQR